MQGKYFCLFFFKKKGPIVVLLKLLLQAFLVCIKKAYSGTFKTAAIGYIKKRFILALLNCRYSLYLKKKIPYSGSLKCARQGFKTGRTYISSFKSNSVGPIDLLPHSLGNATKRPGKKKKKTLGQTFLVYTGIFQGYPRDLKMLGQPRFFVVSITIHGSSYFILLRI